MFLVQLPKLWLQMLVEACRKGFDALLNADVEPTDLICAVWVFTGTRANTHAVNFAAKNYKDLCDKFRFAGARIRRARGKEQ